MGFMFRTKIDGRRRITIPREVMDNLNLRCGQAVVMCTTSPGSHILIISETEAIGILDERFREI
jgi:bifunctional DNA-binding transcriptional regulator/antitoxin component of YhaV-PrlF toxin-antitoxin module